MTTILLTLALAVAAPGPKDKPRAEAGPIEGQWVLGSYVQGGQPDPKRIGLHFTFDQGTVTVAEEGQGIRYAVRPKADPPEIDLTAAKDAIPGIYKIDGGTLTICFPKGGGKDRPTRFESPAGSPLVLMTLKRDKKKD